jgi:hypothetical protein
MASLAGDALIEAIDGPNAVGSLEGKSMPVLTRFPDGRIGFRMMGKFAKTPAPVPMMKVVFENGRSVRVGADQIFVKAPMVPVSAADLKPGDGIEVSWDYPDGYQPADVSDGRPANRTLRVQSVTPDGEAEAFFAPIRETGVFFLTCGALLQA